MITDVRCRNERLAPDLYCRGHLPDRKASYFAHRSGDEGDEAVIAFTSIVVLAITTQPALFHVATDGNDANPGTQAAPLPHEPGERSRLGNS
jgi:hypothetical protein